MGRRGSRADDGRTSPSIQEIVATMTSSAAPQIRYSVRKLSQHEIVVARLAVAHDNGGPAARSEAEQPTSPDPRQARGRAQETD